MTVLRSMISSDPCILPEGGGATVQPLHPDQTRGLPPGLKVTFGVWSEHFHPLGNRRSEGQGGQLGLVTVKVALAKPIGPETVPVGKLARQMATIACKPEAAQPVCSKCTHAIDVTKACFFDPASGPRL